MKISILQISDLHRDPRNAIRNDVLLQSLENDRQRYTRTTNPTIKTPDLIIVSGDIIQGVPRGVADYEEELRKQYAEAISFLGQITDRVLGGDRQRVIIVPGNHDVSACHLMESVTKHEIQPDRKKALASRLFSPDSLMRWSWDDLELFEITNAERYRDRLAAFAQFYSDFYQGTRTYDLDPSKQFDVFDYPQFNLTISGFSSCHNNDILNKQGMIHPACIAGAQERLRLAEFNGRLRVAVWHHNTEGSPIQTDYMESDVLQNLIDGGFSIGFHGHQHRPQFLNTRFRYGEDRRIQVISAGTLCGGASFAHGRAYNIVEIDTEEGRGRLHLREMQNNNLQNPIWGRRALRIGSNADYLEFSFDPPPEPIASNANTESLLEAQRLIEAEDYRGAAVKLEALFDADGLARRMLLECLQELDDQDGIVARFAPPQGSSEIISVMEALWKTGRKDQLRDLLGQPDVAAATDLSVAELRDKYAARV